MFPWPGIAALSSLVSDIELTDFALLPVAVPVELTVLLSLDVESVVVLVVVALVVELRTCVQYVVTSPWACSASPFSPEGKSGQKPA